MAMKQSFYKDFAEFMATKGFCTYTFDYRGIGASRPASLKGLSATLMDWAMDIQVVQEYARKKYENLPLFLVGHSMGGQLLGLTKSAANWDAVTTVAVPSGYWGHWSGKYKFRTWLFWHSILPVITKAVGYFPAKKMRLFEDIPKGVALQWAHWGRHPLYMKRDFPKAYFDKLDCSVRSYSFDDDDEFGPKPAVDWLHQQFVNADVERLHIVPESVELKKIGHFNFFRAKMKSVFWEDCASFFENELNKRSS